MGRTSKALTGGLLICALAAVSVPVGLQVVPAFLPQDPAAVAVLPAAQAAPTSLGEISGVGPLDSTAPLPDADKLSAGLDKALMFDGEGTFSMYVADALTGEELFSRGRPGGKDSRLKPEAAHSGRRAQDPWHRRQVQHRGGGRIQPQ